MPRCFPDSMSMFDLTFQTKALALPSSATLRGSFQMSNIGFEASMIFLLNH
jgi:hypothetical protein